MTEENTSPLSPEQDAAHPAELAFQQLSEMTKYVHNATDIGFGDSGYSSAMYRSDVLAEEAGIDPDAGRIAITAAALGAMTRDPARFHSSSSGLMLQMEREMGLEKAHAGVLYRMCHDISRTHTSAVAIGDVLSSSLSYLKGREQHYGEDVSKARIAFLASGFAATKDQNLREAIYKDLQRNHTADANP